MAGLPWDFYHARIRYAHPDVRWAFVEMTIQGVGAYVVDDYNRFTVSPWTAVHVAGGIDGVEPLGKGLALSLTAAVENLLDRRYAASGWINPDVNRAGEAIYLEPGMGRNLVVTAGIRWAY